MISDYVAYEAQQELEKIAGALAAGGVLGGIAGGLAGYAEGGDAKSALLGAAGGAAVGGAAGGAARSAVTNAQAARAARRARMVKELARKQTIDRLGGNAAGADKFLAGKSGGKLRSAATESLKGTPEYEHLFPNYPGVSAMLGKAGL